MIDPRDRNHRSRRLVPPEPAIDTAHDAYWSCFVCQILNHHSRDRCLKCARPRIRVTEAR